MNSPTQYASVNNSGRVDQYRVSRQRPRAVLDLGEVRCPLPAAIGAVIATALAFERRAVPR
jgi:hypothetical protein